ncbi:MAG: hypothetical protein IJI59_00595, partial [Clostridia bacterium]|nr:hypothetical protein [Clostridia bacterium]
LSQEGRSFTPTGPARGAIPRPEPTPCNHRYMIVIIHETLVVITNHAGIPPLFGQSPDILHLFFKIWLERGVAIPKHTHNRAVDLDIVLSLQDPLFASSLDHQFGLFS